MKKLMLKKESLKKLNAEDGLGVQGGFYTTMLDCDTDDHACTSISMCPRTSLFFSCDQPQ